MPHALEQLMQKMTIDEREEVTIFAEFILTRRHLHSLHMLNDDIPTSDLLGLAVGSGSFDWLDRTEEDGYSLEDGDSVQWPNES